MKALFKSCNLMGDALQTTRTLGRFYERHSTPERPADVTIATLDDYVKILYERMGIPVTVTTAPWEEIDQTPYDFVFDMNISTAWKLAMSTGRSASQAFSIMLGMPTENMVLPVYKVPEEIMKEAPEGLVLFQPYSRSCSSWTNELANKRWLPDENWANLAALIREAFPQLVIKVIGGASDYPMPGMEDCEHWMGRSLDFVAAAQAKAKLVVCIDSGPSHLAASQQANMIEMYPICLPAIWMGKMANPNYQMIHARPAELPVDFVYQVVYEILLGGVA